MKFESEHFAMWYGNLFFIKSKIKLPVLRFRPAISFHANAMHKLCARRYI